MYNNIIIILPRPLYFHPIALPCTPGTRSRIMVAYTIPRRSADTLATSSLRCAYNIIMAVDTLLGPVVLYLSNNNDNDVIIIYSVIGWIHEARRYDTVIYNILWYILISCHRGTYYTSYIVQHYCAPARACSLELLSSSRSAIAHTSSDNVFSSIRSDPFDVRHSLFENTWVVPLFKNFKPLQSNV